MATKKRNIDPITSVGEYISNPLGGTGAGVAARSASDSYHKEYPEREETTNKRIKVTVPDYYKGKTNTRWSAHVEDTYNDFINSFNTYTSNYKTDYDNDEDIKVASVGSAFMAGKLRDKGQKLMDYAKKYPDFFTAPEDGEYDNGSQYIQSLVANALDTVDRMDKSYEKMPEYIRAKKAAEQAAETDQQNASYASADTDALRGELEQLYTEKQKHPEQASEYEERISEKANFLKNAVAYKNAVSAREAQKTEQERMKNFDMSAATAQRNDEKSDYEEAEKRQRVIDHLKENHASNELISEEERKLKKYLHGYDSFDDFKSAWLSREKDMFTYDRNKVLNDAEQLKSAEDYGAVVAEAKAEAEQKNAERGSLAGFLGSTAEHIAYYRGLRNSDNFAENAEDRTAYLSLTVPDEAAEKAGFYMTAPEYNRYMYMSKTDPDKAEKYLEALTEQIETRYAVDIADALDGKTARELTTLFSFAAQQNVEDLKTGLTHMVGGAFNDDSYDYIPPSYRTISHELIDQDLGEGNEAMFGKTWGQIFGDLAWNTGNMLPSVLASSVANVVLPGSGEIIGSAMMGFSAASQSYQEAVNAGYDKDSAREYGIAIGLTETVFERVLGGVTPFSGGSGMSGIAEMLAKNVDHAWQAFFLKWGVSASGEFFEEYLEEWLEPQLKKAILNDDSDVIPFFSSEALYAGLLGFASGLIFDLPGTEQDVHSMSKLGQSVKNSASTSDVVALTNDLSGNAVDSNISAADNNIFVVDSDSAATENTTDGKAKKKKEPTAYRLGVDLLEAGETIGTKNRTQALEQLTERGYSADKANSYIELASDYLSGDTSTVGRIADALVNDPDSTAALDVLFNPRGEIYRRSFGYSTIGNRLNTGNIDIGDALTMSQRHEAESGIERSTETAARYKQAETDGNAYGMPNAVREQLKLGKTEKYRYSKENSGGELRTVRTDSGETATIKDAIINNGKAELVLDNGSTVPASSVTFASKDDAILLHALTASKMDGASAAGVFMDYSGNGVISYAAGMLGGYENGMRGNTHAESYYIDSWGMNPRQYNFAYRLGETAAAHSNQQRIKEAKKTAKTDPNRRSVKGKLELSRSVEKATEKMTKTERAHFDEQRTVGELMAELYPGLKVVLHASEAVEENGQTVHRDIDTHEVLENGWYDSSDGSIHLDINSGINGDGIMAFTMSHELVHYIQDISPDMFRKLTECLSEIYYMEGMSLEELARARAERDDTSYDTAFEESVAHSLERMLLDSDALEYLIKMKKRESGLFNHLRGHVDESYEHVKQLRAEYEGRKPESVEGRVLGHGTETILQAYEYAKDEQEKAYKAYAEAKDSASRKERIVELSEARKVLHAAEARLEQARTYTASMTKMYKRLHKLFAKAAYMASENGEIIRSSDKAWSEMIKSDTAKNQVRGETHTAQEEVTAEYKKTVDGILNDSKNVRGAVLVGYTPDIYQKLGMPSLPFVIGAGHIYSIAKTEEEAKSEGRFREKVNYHGLGQKAVENIYSKLLDPIMIIASKDVDQSHTPMRSTHSVVAIVDFESKDRKLLLPLELTAKRTVNGQRLDVNVLSTAYDKDSAELVREAIALENIGDVGIYYAKKEATMLAGARVQFPKRLQRLVASTPIIHKFNEKVNRNISTNTQSQQFLRWFGDWLNHPKDASKVVNDDGSPRVVYHGTNSEFWTFDIGKSGKNFGDVSEGLFFFTNKKNGYQDSASDYAKRAASKGGNERIIECYLDIKKPLHIYSDGYYTPTSYFDSNAKAIYGEYLRGNYDGIIIENSDKSIDDSVIYMLDDPSQIKSATDNIGTFDRNNPDIRYQQRAKSEETLRAETAETILRDKYNVNVGKLLEGMDSMLENYKGSKSRKELEADILEAAVKTNEFSSGEGSFKHMSDAIESLTDEIIASSPVLTTEIADDNAVEAQRAIKEMRFKVSDKIKADFESAKDYESFRKQHIGRLPIISSGVDVDVAYAELNSRFGESLFPSDIVNPADQLRQIAEITDLKPRTATETEIGEIRNAMMSSLYRAFSDPVQSEKLSARERLVTAMESQLNTRTEYDILRRYRSRLNETAKYEQHIHELESEIAAARKEGKKTSELRDKYTELQKEKNRLAVVDSQLLRTELSEPLRNAAEIARERQLKRTKARMKAKEQEKIKNIKEDMKQQLKEQRAEAREKQLATIRRKNEQIADIKKQHTLKAREKRENRNKTELRHSIAEIADDFRARMTNPTERRYVPTKLMEGIVEVCNEIDPTGADQDTLTAQRFRNGKDALRELKAQYDALQTFDDYEFSSEYDAEFASHIEELADAVGDTPLRDMDIDQLQDVYNIISDISFMLDTATKQIGTDESITNYKAGQEIIRLMGEVKELGYSDNTVSNLMREWMDNPIRAVREMSAYNYDSRLVKLFEALNEGRRKADYFRMQANKEFDKLRSTKEEQKNFNDAVEKAFDFGLTDINGEPLKITKMQAMQLVMSYNRQEANDGPRHLDNGALILDYELLKKGKYAEALDRAQRTGLVDIRMISQIMAGLSEWDKQYMATAEKFFDVTAKDAINETTMQTKHRMVATDKKYIPYNVNRDEVAHDNENIKFDATIEGWGSLKSVKKNANQRIIISGLNTLIADHIDSTAKVYGLAVPVRNFNKVINMRETASDGGMSVREAIRNTWHNGGLDLVEQAVADLQSSRPGKSKIGAAFKSIKSVGVTAALASNISVAIKQAASYPTAGAILSNKALIKGLASYFAKAKDGVHAQDVWNEIDAHTSQHWIRRIGLSMQELGELNQSKGLLNNINRTLGKASPMNWIQAIDVGTTAAIWYACKEEVESKGISADANNYWSEVTKLYDSVIEETQPMYDSLHRAEISKDSYAKNIFMFTTQPLQNSGILREGAMEYKFIKKRFGKNSTEARAAGAKFIRAITSQAASHFVFTAMTLLSKFLLHKLKSLKDDDDEVTAESVLAEFGKEFGKNYLGAIFPIVGNIALSACEKIFGSNRYDVLSDFAIDKANSTFETFAKLSDPTPDNLADAVCEVASYFGIPAKNAKDIVVGAWQNIEDIINGTPFGGGNPRKELYNAIKKRDSAAADEIMADITRGKDLKPSTVIRQVLREYDDRVHDAAMLRYNGDIDGYAELVKAVRDDGFDLSDVIGAVNSELNKIEKENAGETDEPSSASDSTSSDITQMYNKSDIIRAYGDAETTVRIANEMQQAYIDGGRTKAEAKLQTRTRISTAYYDIYRKEYLAGNKEEARMKIYATLRETHLYPAGGIADLLAGWNKRIMKEQRESK